MAKTDSLPDMPPTPPKPKRTEQLHIAYTPATADAAAFADVVVFGTKLEAYEHAIEQDPPWKVAPLRKGQKLSEAVTV